MHTPCASQSTYSNWHVTSTDGWSKTVSRDMAFRKQKILPKGFLQFDDDVKSDEATNKSSDHDASTTAAAASVAISLVDFILHPVTCLTVVPFLITVRPYPDPSGFNSSLALRQPRSIQQEDPTWSWSRLRQGKDGRSWSQGSGAERKQEGILQWRSDAGRSCARGEGLRQHVS